MKKIFLVLFIIIISIISFAEYSLYSESFFQTDLREAISQISYDSGVTIIMDPGLVGVVTIDIYDKPVETILDMILMPFGYAWKKIDDYILVGVPNPSSGTSIHLNDTYIMKVRYLEPRTLVQLLPKYFQNFVSFSDSDKTIIVINAPPKIAGTIANTLRKIDLGRPELFIEVRVVQIDFESFKKWNISNFSISDNYKSNNENYNSNAHFELSEQGADLLYKLINTDFALIIDKAISEGEAKVVSNSKLRAISGENGSLSGKILDEKSTSVKDSVNQFIGFEVSVTPNIMPGKKVRLNLEINLYDKRNIDTEKTSYLTNRMSSTFVLNLDQEVTCAAFNYSTNSKQEIGIPILSQIPGIGSLFKTSIEKNIEQQLIFMVTCHASGGEIQ